MYSDTLEEAGLTPNESKIYEALLYIGEAPVSQISLKSGVHRRNVYDALARLTDKGLVFPIFQKGENIYKAVNPDKLLEILEERKIKIEKILPHLRNMHDSEPEKNAAFIYKGLEGFKNYMRDLTRVAQDTYFLGAKGLWFTPGIEKYYLENFKKVAHQKKLQYFTLYDPRIQKQCPQALKEVSGKYKILPSKYSTPGVVDIFGDHVVTFTSVDIANFGEDGTIFVMVNPELAQTYRTWFQLIWDLIKK